MINIPRYRLNRRGATIVYTSLFLVFMFGMAAFAIEVGTMMVARANLQGAADASALAAASVVSKSDADVKTMAKLYAGYHEFLGAPIQLADNDITIGFWDQPTQVFTPDVNGNAVEVIAKVENASLQFGTLLGRDSFSRYARAVAVAPARDIVFVVDLSGSMNDDTEPVWATNTINDMFAGSPYAGVGSDLMQNLFNDLGYGSYPGKSKLLGYSKKVAKNEYAYAELTEDAGPLADASIPAADRIVPSDNELQRKQKCYRYLIDNEIADMMPDVLPVPDSSINYAYWARYLEYISDDVYIHSTPYDPGDEDDPPTGPEPPPVGLHAPNLFTPSVDAPPGPFQFTAFCTPVAFYPEYGSPPVDRGWIPIWETDDRIYRFNNPNSLVFANADDDTRWNIRNMIGYETYVQFMLDYGRDEKPDGINYVPLSVNSPHCPLHSESTDGGNFTFPPRTQPMHSCRRALISAIEVIKQRNVYAAPDQKDNVAIITFDRLSAGTTLAQALTDNYDAAMNACTMLQASVDKGQTTATEVGMKAALDYIKQERDGGSGRNNVNKVVVLLTDGQPNAYESSDNDINQYQTDNSNDNFYSGGYYWLDAPLMQTKIMSRKGWQIHPVGIGFGTDYDFMDRMARMGGTAQGGQSLRGSGNPALYEERLRELFQVIVEDPMVNLAQ